MITDMVEELKAASRDAFNRKFPCKLRSWLETQSRADAADILKIVKGREFSALNIVNALRKRGLDVSRNTLTRHRNEVCKSCEELLK